MEREPDSGESPAERRTTPTPDSRPETTRRQPVCLAHGLNPERGAESVRTLSSGVHSSIKPSECVFSPLGPPTPAPFGDSPDGSRKGIGDVEVAALVESDVVWERNHLGAGAEFQVFSRGVVPGPGARGLGTIELEHLRLSSCPCEGRAGRQLMLQSSENPAGALPGGRVGHQLSKLSNRVHRDEQPNWRILESLKAITFIEFGRFVVLRIYDHRH